jgi:hypothetical protein
VPDVTADPLADALSDVSAASVAAAEDAWPKVAAWARKAARAQPAEVRSELVSLADAAKCDPLIDGGLHERVADAAERALPGILSTLRRERPDAYDALAAGCGAEAHQPPADVAAALLDDLSLMSFVLHPALERARERAADTPVDARGRASKDASRR